MHFKEKKFTSIHNNCTLSSSLCLPTQFGLTNMQVEKIPKNVLKSDEPNAITKRIIKHHIISCISAANREKEKFLRDKQLFGKNLLCSEANKGLSAAAVNSLKNRFTAQIEKQAHALPEIGSLKSQEQSAQKSEIIEQTIASQIKKDQRKKTRKSVADLKKRQQAMLIEMKKQSNSFISCCRSTKQEEFSNSQLFNFTSEKSQAGGGFERSNSLNMESVEGNSLTTKLNHSAILNQAIQSSKFLNNNNINTTTTQQTPSTSQSKVVNNTTPQQPQQICQQKVLNNTTTQPSLSQQSTLQQSEIPKSSNTIQKLKENENVQISEVQIEQSLDEKQLKNDPKRIPPDPQSKEFRLLTSRTSLFFWKPPPASPPKQVSSPKKRPIPQTQFLKVRDIPPQESISWLSFKQNLLLLPDKNASDKSLQIEKNLSLSSRSQKLSSKKEQQAQQNQENQLNESTALIEQSEQNQNQNLETPKQKKKLQSPSIQMNLIDLGLIKKKIKQNKEVFSAQSNHSNKTDDTIVSDSKNENTSKKDDELILITPIKTYDNHPLMIAMNDSIIQQLKIGTSSSPSQSIGKETDATNESNELDSNYLLQLEIQRDEELINKLKQEIMQRELIQIQKKEMLRNASFLLKKKKKSSNSASKSESESEKKEELKRVNQIPTLNIKRKINMSAVQKEEESIENHFCQKEKECPCMVLESNILNL